MPLFPRDETKVERLVMAFRMRWLDLLTLTASRGSLGVQLIETEEPDSVLGPIETRSY